MFFGIDLTQIIEVLGYPGIFAIVLAESGLFFGVSLPGGSLLFTSGLLASQGYLNIYILLVTVITAAVLGDTIGYWFGAWVGPALWRRSDSRFFKKAYLEQTRVFFDKHGSRTIVLARFIPVVRTFAPILAGVAQMRYEVFFFYNALGALIWGGGFVLGGYFLGQAVPGIENYLEYFIIGIIVVTIIPLMHQVYKRQMRGQQGQTLPSLARSDLVNIAIPKAVIFDMDDTLAESFVAPTDEILDKLVRLAKRIPVAIMSGAAYARMQRDILDRIPREPTEASLYIFSDSAAQCHVWKSHEWKEAYNFPLTDDERIRIQASLRDAISESGMYAGTTDTSRILDRETSVAFTALPQGATHSEKRAWDPDGSKRRKLYDILSKKLPHYEILVGGKTTIDITKKGMTKAYGVDWLARELNLKPETMLFIGDGFYEGGNDAVVIPTGIQTRQISSPQETEEVIDQLLQKFEARNSKSEKDLSTK